MKYNIQKVYAIVDKNGCIFDFRDTEEEAEFAARVMEQDDADRAAVDRVFEAVDN